MFSHQSLPAQDKKKIHWRASIASNKQNLIKRKYKNIPRRYTVRSRNNLSNIKFIAVKDETLFL